jgi:hypothetical protein
MQTTVHLIHLDIITVILFGIMYTHIKHLTKQLPPFPCSGWRMFLRTRAQIVESLRRNPFACSMEFRTGKWCLGVLHHRVCLLTLAYYAFPRWYEFGERRWNDILTGENRRTRRKSCPSATLSTTNPTWIDPGANPGLRGERSAINNLRYGTAH